MSIQEKDLTATMDIFNATKYVLEFTHDQNLESFSKDLKTLYAVLHQFLIIGEASKRVSDAFKLKHSEIPWSQMAKMRDKLIHHYTNVDSVIIWQTIKSEIIKLNQNITIVLKQY
jgi:uncharacterized protein with HEPN domain